ncbi:DUF2818 family protein [Burkholderia sp. Ac-20365]|nr:DUF2818 family protein [Burkholderia sp. Ac-20365]
MSIPGWFVVVLALFLVNLPFGSDRVFGMLSLRRGKNFWIYMLEFASTYLILAATSYLLEAREGAVFVQGWPFYVMTILLLMVFSFPSFVIRFLLPRV